MAMLRSLRWRGARPDAFSPCCLPCILWFGRCCRSWSAPICSSIWLNGSRSERNGSSVIGIIRGRTLDWILAGVFLAGAFWSKYAAIVLAAPLGLFLLFDPVARRAWRTSGPYSMAIAFTLVMAPNAWWLVASDFLPFNYVDQ